MCFAYDAKPPITPIAGAAVDSEDLVLTSADSTKFGAFVARAENPSGAGMVILPDVRGLYPFYEELALRFAEEGINAVTFDFFGRTAGVAKRDDTFDFMPFVRQTKADEISDDVGACVAYLRSEAGGSCTSIFTVGFCFGGSNSWLQAANGHGLAGAIGFYGRPGPSFADGSPGPIDRAKGMTAPILALMGGADQGIPADQIAELESALNAAGVENEVITYEGAPHSFFDRTAADHATASADAWQRCLAFVRQHHKS
ncbi:MAG: dienelactone hydrolase family protein [Tepidiformaceae bacterium]